MKDPAPEIGIEAWAALYDFLSVSFSYPGLVLYQALTKGRFMEEITAISSVLPLRPNLDRVCRELADGVSAVATKSLADLETEYITLFEIGRDPSPVHPYARLYVEPREDEVALFQRLRAAYHAHGITLKSGKGADQPDHLTVELEFMGYLFQSLAQALRDRDEGAAARFKESVQSFHRELVWIPVFVAELEYRFRRPFYVPLGRFLAGVELVLITPKLLHHKEFFAHKSLDLIVPVIVLAGGFLLRYVIVIAGQITHPIGL